VIQSSNNPVEKRWIGDKRTVGLLILVGALILGNIATGLAVYCIINITKASDAIALEHNDGIIYLDLFEFCFYSLYKMLLNFGCYG